MKNFHTSIRNTNVFKLYDIEKDFKRHKSKITSIKNKNAKQSVQRQYHSQLNIANQLKRKWITAQVSKNNQKQKQIYEQNQALYNQILQVRNRPIDRKKIFSQMSTTTRIMRTSYSLNRQNSRVKIQKDNQKLMQRLLTTKSPLAKDNFKNHYKKVKQTKKRLQTHSSINKSRIKLTLKKMNIQPSIYLPDLVNSRHKKGLGQSRSQKNKIDNSFIEENQFIQKHTRKRHQQNISFALPNY